MKIYIYIYNNDIYDIDYLIIINFSFLFSYLNWKVAKAEKNKEIKRRIHFLFLQR